MSKSSTSKPVFKKFCKVCQDAGKPESEFTSHNVRESKDPKSKTLCPTLLAQECRHCSRKGHTVKYCSILKKQQQSTPTSYVGTPAKKAYQHKVSNVFMLLESDSEEGEDEADMTTIKKPVLDYTNIIRIVEQEEVEVEVKPKTLSQIPRVTQIPRVFGKSRWLDVVSSSDEEDDCDEE